MSVFISYSHKDSDFVDDLHKRLIERDIPIFLDRLVLNVGDSIISKIENAIEESRLILVVVSSNSVESSWCRLELNSGWVREIEEKNVVVVPIVIDNCKMPLFLKTKKYADFSVSYDHGLNELMKLLISLDMSQNSLSNYDQKNLKDFGWCITSKDNRFFIDIDCVEQTLHSPRPEHIVVSNIKIYFPVNFSISFMVEGVPEKYNREKINALMNCIAENGVQEFIEINDGLKSYTDFSFKHLDELFDIEVTCRKLGPSSLSDFLE